MRSPGDTGSGGSETVRAAATPDPGERVKALVSRLQNALERLRGATPDQARETLSALRDMLWAEDRSVAVAAMLQLLASGRDVPTGLGFEVGAGGVLSEAGSFRVFLLDLLGQMDPAAALEAGRAVLAEKRSADEWAVALRNAAWAGDAQKPMIAAKALEMLRHEPWGANPSPGFLEAFDAAVYAGATDTIAVFGEWIGTATDAKLRASLVAMNRFAALKPLDVARYLNNNPSLLADRPLVRADYYTLGDFTDPRQIAAVEGYLARPDVTLDEKRKFLAALESPGYMVGDSLLTTIPKVRDFDRREVAIEALARTWLGAGRFPELRVEIEELSRFRMATP